MSLFCALIILTSTPSIKEIKAEIIRQAQVYGVDERKALAIADCESDFNSLAKNKKSSAKGVYQFINKTWSNYCKGDVMNYKDNIECFMRLYPAKKHWWQCKG